MLNKNDAVKFDRVSSKDQRDGFSLDAQKRLGEKYATDKKLRIVESWSVDESASKHKDRKHFFAMIDFVKEKKIKNVIFDKVDRACRNLESAVQIEELIDQYQVKFHFTREHLIIDRDSPPQEKLRFYLGIILGKYYIDNLKSEIKKGLDERVSNGHWNGKAPFGYLNKRIGANKKAVIEIDPDLAPLVKEVFELYSTGNYGWDALALFIKSKVSGGKITKRLVENMIVNPFYYGYMRIKGKVIKGSHMPIISKDLYDSCQKIKGIRAKNCQSKRKGHIPKPFMGLFKCGECGHSITGESVKKSSGKIYIYYRCANSGCAQNKKRINQFELEKVIAEAFVPFCKWTPKATESFIDNMAGRLEDLDLYTQKMSGELAEQRLELKKRVVEIGKLYRQGKLTEAEYSSIISGYSRMRV